MLNIKNCDQSFHVALLNYKLFQLRVKTINCICFKYLIYYGSRQQLPYLLNFWDGCSMGIVFSAMSALTVKVLAHMECYPILVSPPKLIKYS